MYWGAGGGGAGLAALLPPTREAAARRLSTSHVPDVALAEPVSSHVCRSELASSPRRASDGLAALERAGSDCLTTALGAVGTAVRAKLVEPLAPERAALATAAPRSLGPAFPDTVRSEDPLYFEALQAAAERGASGDTAGRGRARAQYVFDRLPVPRSVDAPSLVIWSSAAESCS